MAEVRSVDFHRTADELLEHLAAAAEEFAQERGLQFDRTALRQSGVDLRHAGRDILMFGCDLWPGEDVPEPVTAGGNVLVFRPRRGRVSRVASMIRTAASSAGAFVGMAIIAAACTESVNLPGFPVLAEAIYLKNAPDRVVRYLEVNGRYVKLTASRRDGEHGAILHVDDLAHVSREVAHGIGKDEEAPALATSKGERIINRDLLPEPEEYRT